MPSHLGIESGRAIGTGLNNHGHRYGMSHNKRLLASIETCQHLLQRPGSAYPRKNRPNVSLIIEQAGHTRAYLTHHLWVNATGTLIHDQQGVV